jgi:hypothetical protein
MRDHFVDEIVSLAFDDPPRIEVAKRFDAGEDVFTGPQGPRRVPESMLVELMAMTSGQLIFRHLGGSRLPLLLKVPECLFDGVASVGEPLRAVASLRGFTALADPPSVVETEVYVDAAPIARARLMFVCLEMPTGDLAHGVGP